IDLLASFGKLSRSSDIKSFEIAPDRIGITTFSASAWTLFGIGWSSQSSKAVSFGYPQLPLEQNYKMGQSFAMGDQRYGAEVLQEAYFLQPQPECGAVSLTRRMLTYSDDVYRQQISKLQFDLTRNLDEMVSQFVRGGQVDTKGKEGGTP